MKDLKKFQDRNDIDIGEYDFVQLENADFIKPEEKEEEQNSKHLEEEEEQNSDDVLRNIDQQWLQNQESSSQLFSSIVNNLGDNNSVNTYYNRNTSISDQNSALENLNAGDLVNDDFNPNTSDNPAGNENAIFVPPKTEKLNECVRLHKMLTFFKKNNDITEANYSLRVCSNIVEMLEKLKSKTKETDVKAYMNECCEMIKSLAATMNETFKEMPAITKPTKKAEKIIKISIEDFEKVPSNCEKQSIEDMPIDPDMSWGIRPEDCPWKYARVITGNFFFQKLPFNDVCYHIQLFLFFVL